MRTTIEFNSSFSFQNGIEIPSIGNFSMVGVDNLNQNYFIVVVTQLGMTKYLTWGPVIDNIICDNYKLEYQEFEFDENKLRKKVNEFLNSTKGKIPRGPSIKIQDAKLIDIVEALSNQVNPYEEILDD